MKYICISMIILLTMAITSCSPSQPAEDPVAGSYTLSGNGCIALSYHRIRKPSLLTKAAETLSQNKELTTYSIYEDEFEKQIFLLKQNGITFITPDDLKDYLSNKRAMPNKCALVTFDDIDVSVYENAYPFLKREHIPFTVFVVTGEVGNSNFNGLQMVTWQQLKEMHDSGLTTIGTHTNNLHYLEQDQKPPFLKVQNLELFKKDALQSKKIYKEHFGSDPVYFAYPFGFGIPQTDEFLLSQKYNLLFSLHPGIIKQGDPSFFISRILVEKQTWPIIANWAKS